LTANLLNGDAIAKASFKPEQRILAMIILDLSAKFAASGCLAFKLHTSLFSKEEQTSSKCPEAEDSLSCHHLVVVTSEQIFLIFEKSLHFPTNRQDIYQGLSVEAKTVLPQ